jgi:hypothetical protein
MANPSQASGRARLQAAAAEQWDNGGLRKLDSLLLLLLLLVCVVQCMGSGVCLVCTGRRLLKKWCETG